jgi:hypothetical protein
MSFPSPQNLGKSFVSFLSTKRLPKWAIKKSRTGWYGIFTVSDLIGNKLGEKF